MKNKLTALFLLLAVVVLSFCGCDDEWYPGIDRSISEHNGVQYQLWHGEYRVYRLTEEAQKREIIYIPDEINGYPVTTLGISTVYSASYSGSLYGEGVKRIYLPWSIENTTSHFIGFKDAYVISSCTEYIMDDFDRKSIYVIPNYSYENGIRFTYYMTDVKEMDYILPANVAFFFNYEGNPNQGYFYVDLLESTGTIQKPPYDPKREDYIFVGWYKEPECINAWDFDTDVVTIKFEEEGNRIYEELCLYAKWNKK